MKRSILILCLVFAIVMSSEGTTCRKSSDSCNNSRECCSQYCRDRKCINFGDAPDDQGSKNPCKPNPCKSDEICLLEQVTCFRFPCPPVRSCQKK